MMNIIKETIVYHLVPAR